MAAREKQKVIVEPDGVYIMEPGLPVYIKTAALCNLTGTSNQWIGQLTSQGVVNRTKTPHGSLYELAPSMKSYCKMLEERASKTEDEKLERERHTSENSIKKAKAIVAVMEAHELQGKMHRSEDVAAMTSELVTTIRNRLLALPGQLAVDVSECRSAAEAATIIRNAVYSVMDELSRFRYDPKKYEERVRERRNWENRQSEVSTDDED